MTITRRFALLGGLMGGVSACATRPQLGEFSSADNSADATFACGVASGDPAMDSVVLWTRVHGAQGGGLTAVAEVADDASFGNIVWTRKVETGPERDWTVKTIAEGLEPGRRYAYRFRVLDRISPTGFTKTLPEETSRVRFAVASCSNFAFGFFNAYDHMARQDDLDAVIHLGDYLYEYGRDGYGGAVGKELGREHLPAHEILSLEDYRQRHRQYKMDASCQAMHGAHAFIPVWDDHETSNDAWQRGAENHDASKEGSWETRKRAALQAYFEYMPVRENAEGGREQFYRSFSWGKFLTLTAVETRLNARTKQISYLEAVSGMNSQDDADRFRAQVLEDPARELLGAAQQAFLTNELKKSVDSGATWRVLANQVLMARVLAPDLGPFLSEEAIAELESEWSEVRPFLKWAGYKLPFNTDAWDGYPAARERFYNEAESVGATDLLVLTGDTHQFWANDLKRDNGKAMGVELGTSGVTSPGAGAFFGDQAFDLSLLMRRDNEDIRYADVINKGYTIVELKEDRGRAEFISMDTVLSPNYKPFRSAAFNLRHRNGTLELGSADGLGFKEWVLYR